MYKPCSHKIMENHKTVSGNYWVCSNCGHYGLWNENWSYWGNYECRKCQRTAIDWVACSDKCAQALEMISRDH